MIEGLFDLWLSLSWEFESKNGQSFPKLERMAIECAGRGHMYAHSGLFADNIVPHCLKWTTVVHWPSGVCIGAFSNVASQV